MPPCALGRRLALVALTFSDPHSAAKPLAALSSTAVVISRFSGVGDRQGGHADQFFGRGIGVVSETLVVPTVECQIIRWVSDELQPGWARPI
jgi:hypothetical protein